jgi:DNA ligase-1
MAHAFRVLLAPTDSPKTRPTFFEDIPYPRFGSAKFDGIRTTNQGGDAISRTGIALPSYQVQDEFKYPNLDAEAIEGCETDVDVYNRTNSHVMSRDKPGDMSYWVFDFAHEDLLDEPYYMRMERAELILREHGDPLFHAIEQEELNSHEEMLEFEDKCLKLGFEGIMLRDPVGRYKQGRATWKEQIICKLKRFEDAEGIIVDFVEGQHNQNPKMRDELGYAKRSTAKAGMVGADTLGKFKVDFEGQIISVAPGKLNHKARKEIWDNKDFYRGQLLKFRYFKHGVKDKPRFPRAVGFRKEIDL